VGILRVLVRPRLRNNSEMYLSAVYDRGAGMFSFPSTGLLCSATLLLVVAENTLVAGTNVVVDRGTVRRKLRVAMRASGRNARDVDMALGEDRNDEATMSYLGIFESDAFERRISPASHLSAFRPVPSCKSPEWDVLPDSALVSNTTCPQIEF